MGHFFTQKALAGEMQLRDVGLALSWSHPGDEHDQEAMGKAQRLAIRPWITLGHFPEPA